MILSLFAKKLRVDVEHAAIPAGLRIYAIGDIHGCVANLDRLHHAIVLDLERCPADARVIYLGDYIDRGPDSKGVLDTLSQLGGRASRIFLKGNHEDMILRFLEDPNQQGEQWCNFGGFETLLSYRIDVKPVLAQGGFEALAAELKGRMPSAHSKFLAELRLSADIGDYFFCHAGVRPRVPLDRQDPHDLMWIRQEFLRSDHNHGKIIVHGHSAVENPEIKANRINVDTGAYATGRLSALVLEGTERRFLTA